MKFFSLLILLSLSSGLTIAQNKVQGVIKGKVKDAQNNLPLEHATVTLLDRQDSVAVGFSVADKEGLFEIKNIRSGAYIFGISFTGYRQFVKNIDITATVYEINLDSIMMEPDTSMLQSVTVTAPPITIKEDTVEFRAASFKTKPNATAEDLLKKLPGVEVDKDGNVTSEGEAIPKVYVDGKEFFGNDPKMATKNLTAEMIESVQVFDDMSDQAKFTKIDDGSRQRVINIKLKKNRKQGIFGRVQGGIGSSDRYTGNASVNMFNNNTQLSVVGGANNVNRLGYSFDDLVSSMGGMGGFGGRGGRGGGNVGRSAGNGNTKSWNAGANFRDEWGSKVEFSGHYFISNSDNTNRNSSYRQNFFPNDSISYSNENSFRINSNLNHRLGIRLEYAIDSMNSILITPNIDIQHSESASYDSLTTIATSPKFSYQAIAGKTERTSQRDGVRLNNNLLFRHRFRKPGRTLTIGWNTSVNDSDGEGFNLSPIYFYNPDSTVKRINDRRQRNEQLTNAFNNTISTSVTELIDSNKIFELNYAYTLNKSISDRDTWDYDENSGKFDSINKLQTNYFENTFTASRIGTNFRVRNKKYSYQFGGAVQMASLENLSHRAQFGKDSVMKQRYTNFFPNASFNYNPGNRKSLRFDYRGRTRAPGITQLQDVQDVSNQLRIRTGNPDLKQEFNNDFNLRYNSFNIKNFMYFNIRAGASFTSNRIVSSIDSLENAVQLIKPENVNGSYNLSFSGTLGIPLKKVTTGRRSPVNLNLTTSFRYSRDVSKLYKQINFNYTRRIGQRINFNYNIDDKLDLGANASFNYNDARYSVQENLNYQYFNHNYSLDVTYTFFKNFMLSSDFDYYVNSGRADGFNQSVPLWNASLAWVLFKKRNGELRLGVVDLLNQNKNIDRDIGENFIEDTYTEVLQRFFLVSFLYNFNKFTGRNPFSSGRGGDGPRGGRGGGRRF